jgi:hypothetical protein
MAKGFPKNPDAKIQGDSIKRTNPPVQKKTKSGKDLRSGGGK